MFDDAAVRVPVQEEGKVSVDVPVESFPLT